MGRITVTPPTLSVASADDRVTQALYVKLQNTALAADTDTVIPIDTDGSILPPWAHVDDGTTLIIDRDVTGTLVAVLTADASGSYNYLLTAGASIELVNTFVNGASVRSPATVVAIPAGAGVQLRATANGADHNLLALSSWYLTPLLLA